VKPSLIIHKRPFLLLEVLIAFALVSLSMIPLMRPHIVILQEEKAFLKELELDKRVNQFYVDMLESLYNNRIPWEEITQGTEGVFTEEALRSLPYKGKWKLEAVKNKPKKVEVQYPESYHLIELNLSFTPVHGKDREKNTKDFSFTIFITRELEKA
jgi:hypothetical protein